MLYQQCLPSYTIGKKLKWITHNAQKTPLSIAITAAILMSGNVYASDPAVNNDAVNIKDLDQEIF